MVYTFGSLQATTTPSILLESPLRTLLLLVHRQCTMWHNKLRHPHHEALKATLSLCSVSLPNKLVLDFCSLWFLRKINRLPNTSYLNSFDFLFADVWDPTHMISTFGYKYLLTCVNACSKYTWVFLIKLKYDVLLTLTQFLIIIEVQFNAKIKVV